MNVIPMTILGFPNRPIYDLSCICMLSLDAFSVS
jgi:hypothetical protein